MPDRHSRRTVLHRLSRRQTLVLSAFIGVFAALVALIFQGLVQLVDKFRWWAHAHGPGTAFLLVLVCALLGALAGKLTDRYCPEASGSGIPQVKAFLTGMKPIRPIPTLLVKMGSGLLALAGGLSLGREGPTIHLGAALAAGVSDVLKVPLRTLKSLVAAGAGAGLAAAFNAPLAGFLFIMEELRREMSHTTYGTALVSSVAAVAMTRLCLGPGSTFHLHDVAPPRLSCFPAVILVAVVCTLVGVLFNRLLLSGVRWRRKKQVPRHVTGGVVGALAGIMVCFFPELTGGGLALSESILQGHMQSIGLLILLGLLVGKLLFTAVSYCTGLPGGIFAPLLTIGSLTGFLLGHWADGGLGPQVMATVGMASVLSASVQAPLTGVVLIVEMTGQYHLIHPLMVASFIAFVLAELMHTDPIYHALLNLDLEVSRPMLLDEAQIVELLVEPSSRLDRVMVRDLHLHPELLLAMVDRDGYVMIPHGNTRLQADDLLVATVGTAITAQELNGFVELARAP